MIPDDPALTFALTLKRWFAANGWPQKITDDWARDVNHPNGPWASQVCNALKASGYNPKAEFFLALGTFNQTVASQDLLAIKDTKLKDRLTDAKPLLLDNGQPYGGAEFWSLYAGLIQPPEELQKNEQLTEADVQEWTTQIRQSFKQIALKNMCSKAEAWDMLKEVMIRLHREYEPGRDYDGYDDLEWLQEVLAGFREPTVDEAIRQAKRWSKHKPMQRAMEELLGVKKQKPTVSEERRSTASQSPFPSMRS